MVWGCALAGDQQWGVHQLVTNSGVRISWWPTAALASAGGQLQRLHQLVANCSACISWWPTVALASAGGQLQRLHQLAGLAWVEPSD